MERRQHLRVRPLPELPLEVRDGKRGVLLSPTDISLGGIGLYGGQERPAVGEELLLVLTLGQDEPVEARAVVRHRSGPDKGTFGVAFVELSDSARLGIRRYVSELFERGTSV